MEDWKLRVKAEAEELSGKISKLDDFINKTTGANSTVKISDILMLEEQLHIMRKYLAILVKRIERF